MWPLIWSGPPGLRHSRGLQTARPLARSPGLEQLAQLLPAARDPRAHGTGAHSQDGRDLLVGKALQVAQHHRLAERRRQPRQTTRHLPTQVGGNRQLLRPAARIGQPHGTSFVVRLLRDRLGLRPEPRQPLAAVVQGDAEDPGLERRAAAEAIQVTEDAQEDLLGQISGLVGVPGEAQGQVVDHRRIAGVDLVEGAQVPAAVALSQLEVQFVPARHGGDRGCLHGASPTLLGGNPPLPEFRCNRSGKSSARRLASPAASAAAALRGPRARPHLPGRKWTRTFFRATVKSSRSRTASPAAAAGAGSPAPPTLEAGAWSGAAAEGLAGPGRKCAVSSWTTIGLPWTCSKAQWRSQKSACSASAIRVRDWRVGVFLPVSYPETIPFVSPALFASSFCIQPRRLRRNLIISPRLCMAGMCEM